MHDGLFETHTNLFVIQTSIRPFCNGKIFEMKKSILFELSDLKGFTLFYYYSFVNL